MLSSLSRPTFSLDLLIAEARRRARKRRALLTVSVVGVSLAGLMSVPPVRARVEALGAGHHMTASVQHRIASVARRTARRFDDSRPTKTAEVYGPTSYQVALSAWGGGVTTSNRKQGRYYVIVVRGRFVWDSGGSSRGSILTRLWTPDGHGGGGTGLSNKLPASMARLGRPTTIDLGPSRVGVPAAEVPSDSAQLYRVDPNGRRLDLTSSRAYPLTDVTVSPDGRRVAFLSDRSEREGVPGGSSKKRSLSVYEVGIDGRGLVRFGPFRRGDQGALLAWQPHGSDLAVATGFALRIVRPGGESVRVRSAAVLVGWSPDGRVLVASAPGPRSTYTHRYLAISPLGHTLWTVDNGSVFGAAWSAGGLLAIPTGGEKAGARHGISVYDEAGKLLYSVPLGLQQVTTTWSPSGRRLALTSGRMLQVRTATGRVLLDKRFSAARTLSGPGITWDGDNRIAVFTYGSCACQTRVVDVRTGKISRGSDRFALPTSSDGKLAILTARSGRGFAIQVAPTAGGPAKTYTHVPACDQSGRRVPGAGYLEFVPGSRSILYGSICAAANGSRPG